jgi:hypothetical protein
MNTSELSRTERAIELRNQTIAGNISRLFQMLVDIYGKDIRSLDKIKKREGQEVELHFNALNTVITLNLSKTKLTPYMRSSDKAVASIYLTFKKEQLIPTIVELIRTKNNIRGILKIFIKYIIPRKIRIKGSFGAAIKVIKLLSIGTHPMYK